MPAIKMEIQKNRNSSVFQAFKIPSGHFQALQVHGMEVALEVRGGGVMAGIRHEQHECALRREGIVDLYKAGQCAKYRSG